jgi:hypothetical protein
VKSALREVDTPNLDTAEASAYIADMVGSLAAIANSHGLTALSYILEMAREEAHNHTGSLDGRRRHQ